MFSAVYVPFYTVKRPLAYLCFRGFKRTNEHFISLKHKVSRENKQILHKVIIQSSDRQIAYSSYIKFIKLG